MKSKKLSTIFDKLQMTQRYNDKYIHLNFSECKTLLKYIGKLKKVKNEKRRTTPLF